MADLDKQVAIETGQWTEKQDVATSAKLSDKAALLARAFSVQNSRRCARG